MDWLITILIGFALLILFAPVIMLLVTFFVLVPLSILAPAAPMVARTSFACPFSRRRVDVAFLTSPESRTPSDVVTCSLFADGAVRCKKECLGLAVTGWAPSAMAPRYALLSDGVAFR